MHFQAFISAILNASFFTPNTARKKPEQDREDWKGLAAVRKAAGAKR